ncbi:MAG: hypothetical protein M0R77_14500 [Gammaproteobacteria bacterium]|nr:hypothetical protein [Gammaproteobacteria bacterium]
MLAELAAFLTCPICGKDLRLSDHALRCETRHSFDVARQGYVNLLAGHAPPGNADTQDMVQARAAFLAAGHYRPLADKVARHAAKLMQRGLVIDVGAGTGYYLHALLEQIPHAVGLALDISKFALRRAARAHGRAAAVVWDVWRPLPVKSASAALVLDVFAPRNGAEFRRVLRPDGALLVVTPGMDHLAELVAALGLLTVDEHKEARLEETLSPSFHLAEREELRFPMALTQAEAMALAGMGPSGHHLTQEALAQAIDKRPEPLTVTASFVISVFRPRA